METLISRCAELAHFIFDSVITLLQTVLYNVMQYMVFSFLAKIKLHGQIIVYMDKDRKIFGTNEKRKVNLYINNAKQFYWRCVTQADIGLAEAYINGDFDCDDLTMLLQIFVANRSILNGLDSWSAYLGHLADRIFHWGRMNTKEGSKRNIEDHYDLGNEMFKLFLDPTMTYSCAIYKSESETLEEAQLNKLRAVIQKAQIKKEDHVLEIGSGWGSLCIEAVRMTGCRVTTLTLSVEQKKLADQKNQISRL